MEDKSFGRQVAEQSALAFIVSAASLLGFMVMAGLAVAWDHLTTKKNLEPKEAAASEE